jgi:hypothetical protein
MHFSSNSFSVWSMGEAALLCENNAFPEAELSDDELDDVDFRNHQGLVVGCEGDRALRFSVPK